MKFDREVREIGGSITLSIPADLCKYLGIAPNDKVVIQDYENKKGKYISIWKKEE